jgi:hypothetical protein
MIVSILFAIVGVALSLFGVSLLLKSSRLVRSRKLAPGRIRACHKELRSFGFYGRRETVYHAEVEFSVDGRTIRFVNPYSRGWSYKADLAVGVYYDPLNPEDSPRMRSVVDQWLGPSLLIALGVGFVLASFL